MPLSIAKVLLWLFVMNLGIALGAGLYESRVVVPRWIGSSPGSAPRWNAEAARQDNTGLRFWVYVTTVPLTLLTLANLAVAWRAPAFLRGWWLAAAAAALVDRVFTFSYFIPTMLRLTSSRTIAEPEAASMAMQWVSLDYLRHAIVLAAWLAALMIANRIPQSTLLELEQGGHLLLGHEEEIKRHIRQFVLSH
jgi:hypothetical protein